MTFKPFILAIIWAIAIVIVSVIPGKDLPKFEDWWDLITGDKIVHMVMYGTLAALILRGYHLSSANITGMRKFVIFISCAALGWLLEFIQEAYCDGRLFEKTDGVANMIGAFIVVVSYSIFFKPKNTK